MLDRHRLPAALLALGALVASASAQSVLREWRGATQGDACGLGLADLGDVDQDGVHDFAIGMPGDDTVGADRGKVVLRSGADGHEIQSLQGAHYDKRYGTAIVALGDVNLDGIGDLLIGSASASASASASSAAYVSRYVARSGADGAQLWTYDVPSPLYGVSSTGARLGDCNLDGRPEVAIAMPSLGTPAGAGLIVVLSGLDGAVLQQITGPAQNASIGIGLSAAGDLDGDARADWWNTRNHNYFYNFVQARSGLDGHLLFEIAQPYIYESDYAINLVGGNDVDGDAVPDLVVSIPVTPGYGLNGPGHVYAYSGASAALLWHRPGASNGERVGWWLSDVGDLDRDGVRDLATSVGYPMPSYYSTTNSRALFLSGSTGLPIGTLALPPPELNFTRVLSAGDVDGDGWNDILLGAANVTYSSTLGYVYGQGVARVATLGRVGLRASRFDLDHETGGTQALTLDFGPACAGRTYRVLGSISGTRPGLAMGAGVLPLAVDPYFLRTLRGGGDPHLSTAAGTLDAQGRATASFTLPARSMRFPRDTIVHHAAVVMDASGTSVAVLSRAVPLLVSVDPCHADSLAVDDCDGDGMRDGCQVNLPAAADCNRNARPDACDIAPGGGSSDCDGDQIPDECTDFWRDLNQNDVPDVCEIRTFYVDDDAVSDPGPGTSSLSDPAENGTLQHPFDSIREALAKAGGFDTILLEDGLYTGNDNKGLAVFGRVQALKGRNGPATCVVDAENYGAAFTHWYDTSPYATELVGITFQHTGPFTTGYGSFSNGGSSSGNLRIANCRFLDGAHDKNPGLQVGVRAGATLTIENCVFARNHGGALCTDGYALEILPLGGTFALRNCLFFDNRSTTGRIPVSIGAAGKIDHCTLVGQSGGSQSVLKLDAGTGSAISCVLTNSILVADHWTPLFDVNVPCAASYLLVKGGPQALGSWVAAGAGISGSEPLFVHAAGHDYHVQGNSPALDAGDPAFLPLPGETDGDGEPRVLGGRTDIGWDERP